MTETECNHCGEPVDYDSPDVFKSPSDQFWHPDCFAEHCYERRGLVATPEGSFRIKAVLIKEIEDRRETVIDSFWRADCPVCYRNHESEEKTEEVRSEFIDEVTNCCDTEWLPPADWIEGCDICGGDHRESRDCIPIFRREPFPSAEDHRFDCSECEWSGEAEDFDNAQGECPDCGTRAVRAIEIATDGGRAIPESKREWPSDEEFDGTEVFATARGANYHEDRECRHIEDRSVTGYDKSAAWYKGYDPCGDCASWPDHCLSTDGGAEPDEPELVDELYALRESDRVDVALAGKGESMAIVDEVRTDTDGQTQSATRTILMETLAERTIRVGLQYEAGADESELLSATIDGPGMANAEDVEIAGVAETAQQTIEEAMAQPEESSEWPPETIVLYCWRCCEEHEHERTTSEKTGERAWKCLEHNILNDPLQPRLGAFTGGERA